MGRKKGSKNRPKIITETSSDLAELTVEQIAKVCDNYIESVPIEPLEPIENDVNDEKKLDTKDFKCSIILQSENHFQKCRQHEDDKLKIGRYLKTNYPDSPKDHYVVGIYFKIENILKWMLQESIDNLGKMCLQYLNGFNKRKKNKKDLLYYKTFYLEKGGGMLLCLFAAKDPNDRRFFNKLKLKNILSQKGFVNPSNRR